MKKNRKWYALLCTLSMPRKLLLIMRNSFILLFAILLQISATGLAHKVVIKKNKLPYEQLFNEIEAQTGIATLLSNREIDLNDQIIIESEDYELKELLKVVTKDTELTFELIDDYIIIRPLKPEEKVTVQETGQDEKKITITGTVKDEKGEPLPFVAVRVKDTTIGSVTTIDGKYQLEVPDQDGLILEVSSLGYTTLEFATQGRTEIDFVLVEDIKGLGEVVVTGYQKLSQERSAGSFGKVGSVEIARRSNLDITNTIEGMVPGVLVNDDNTISIRGKSTINAISEPLIVVDGFPTNRGINDIDVNDIGSITFLKDAAAASIWGVRAANGVIVIETRREGITGGDVKVDVSSVVSVSSAPDINDLPFASNSAFMEYEKFRVDNNMVDLVSIPKQAQSQFTAAYLADPVAAEQLAKQLAGINAYDEFDDLFMRPMIKQNYSVMLRSKGEKSQSKASFSIDDATSHFKGDKQTKYIADLYNNYSLSKKLSVNLGLNFTYNEDKNNGLTYAHLLDLPRYQSILDENGNYIAQPFGYDQKTKEDLVALGYPYNWDYNLKQEYDNKDNTAITKHVVGLAKINYEIIDGLDASLGYNYEWTSIKDDKHYNESTYYTRDLINSSTTLDNGTPVIGIPEGGILNQTEYSRASYTVRGLLNYNSMIADKHYIVALAGTEVREVTGNTNNRLYYGYDGQTLQTARTNYESKYTDIRGNQKFINPGIGFSEILNRYVSYFTNVGYTYDERYSINASARLDKTNLFGKNDKYNNVWLWSVGALWNIHNEHFFRSEAVNRLSLRASYGFNGNVDESTSPFLVAEIAQSNTTGLPYAFIQNPANPLLRWEKTGVTNIGVDFGLFNGRLNGTVDYYYRDSKDLLGNTTINGTYGFDRAFVNYASLINKGIELSLSGRIINTDFKWDATFNYSHNKNEVTEVDTPLKTAASYLQGTPLVGKPLDHLYAYRWAGLSTTGQPQVYDENDEVTGYTQEVSSVDALEYMGTTIPKHFGGFLNNFSYKNFELLSTVTYNLGHKFRVPTIQYSNSLFEGGAYIHEDWTRRWQESGDENITSIAAAPTDLNGLTIYDRYMANSDNRVQTASVIRLAELQLNYLVPQKVLASTFINNMVVGFKARNLATITFNDAGLDPDYLVTGSSVSFAPTPEFSFILKASF